ncbi:HAD-like domain-containing protein [Trichophaea hybrida]|nr:HAD-like domain-containing protein [Trichophaea hybrida]
MIAPKLIVFDFDGTLFDTHTSMIHCFSRTFALLSPSGTSHPSPETIRAIISTGAGLSETFEILHAGPIPDIDLWITTYRSFYVSEGPALVTPFPSAEELLKSLKAKGIPLAIVSNKGIGGLEAVLKHAKMEDMVDLLLGDMLGVKKKPDPMSFNEIIVPKFSQTQGLENGQGKLNPEDVLVVGDTEADLLYARNIGAAACWVRYGYGVKEECEKLNPELIVESLEELGRHLGVA